MKEKTCCFTGHRIIKEKEIDSVKIRLEQEIINLIEKDVVFFVCGGALGFDMIAALTILKLKKVYKNIQLIMALPCKNQDKYWNEKDKIIYRNILSLADRIVYISDIYTRDCMLNRNRYMVNISYYCICYLRKNKSGTAYTVNYAKELNLQIVFL